jgi:hypothetical protein
MTDIPSPEPLPEPDAPPPTPPAPAAPPRRRWWHHWKLILTGALAAPALAFALYTVLALSWTYSEGERAGTLTKFSRKGWLCKTWEGELMQPTAPGVAPTIWYFTVRGDSAAIEVNRGLGKRVVLSYREHRGVPTTCFGETSYFVDGIRVEP